MSDPTNKLQAISGAGAAMASSGPRPLSDGQTELAQQGDADTRLKTVSIQPPSMVDGRTVDPYLGCVIDQRYRVERVLGEGGMGIVYQCRHTIIGKLVAMKVLRADLARDAEVTERFLNEAKAASAIGNPHIIDISDFGRLPDGATYFIMEYLDGIPLSGALADGKPMPIARLLGIARQLTEGLSAAHNASIVHRDLKPDNIFLLTRGKQKDFVKILDFGIAKVSSSGQGKLTRAGTVFGTPHYMSPEQAAGAPVDHRGDIYSFGVILYELASGKVPFDADNFMGILTQHMYKAPVPIRALVPQPQDVPPGLEAIILKCLSKRAEQRYASMEELLEDIDCVAEGLVPQAVSEMMARSASFHVPSDYLAKPGMPAPMPATPAGVPGKTRFPVYAAAGVLSIIAIVVAIFALGGRSDATPSSVPVTNPEPAVTEPKAAEQAPTPANAPAVAPATEEALEKVVLAVEPLDAKVFLGDKDLGASPVLVEVKAGQTVTLRVERRGYVAQELVLDGTEGKKSLKLERITAAKSPAPVRPKPEPKVPAPPTKRPSSVGGGELVNPWD
jgi:serine/threonine protein kinase